MNNNYVRGCSYGYDIDIDYLFWKIESQIFRGTIEVNDDCLHLWPGWMSEEIVIEREDIKEIRTVRNRWYLPAPLTYVVYLDPPAKYKNVYFEPPSYRLKKMRRLLGEMGYDSLIVDK